MNARAATCRGFTLIEVLIALVVFALGMLAVAEIYAKLVPVATSNQNVIDTAAIDNQFWGTLQANPAVIVNALGTSATTTYTQSSYTSAPAALQPWLVNIFANPQMQLPGAKVTITTGTDALGDPCSTSGGNVVCGVTLSLNWNNAPGNGSITERSATSQYQLGY